MIWLEKSHFYACCTVWWRWKRQREIRFCVCIRAAAFQHKQVKPDPPGKWSFWFTITLLFGSHKLGKTHENIAMRFCMYFWVILLSYDSLIIRTIFSHCKTMLFQASRQWNVFFEFHNGVFFSKHALDQGVLNSGHQGQLPCIGPTLNTPKQANQDLQAY